MGWGNGSKKAEEGRSPDPGRRRFLPGLLAWIGGLGGSAFLLSLGRSVGAEASVAAAPPGQQPLRPPAALSEEAFRRSCIGCFLCAEVCPPRAIVFPHTILSAQPQRSRVAGTGIDLQEQSPRWSAPGTPWILPWETACTLCLACTKVCPTPALSPLLPRQGTEPAAVHMGLARIDRKVCLPWTRRSWCGACNTICPVPGAISVDYQDRPQVHPEHCVGCGLCVEVCPLRYKAIAVDPPFEADLGHVRPE